VEDVHVLVIDNESAVLEGMNTLLAAWHCQVVAALNEAAALREVDRHRRRPDIILVDYHLNGGRLGLDVIRSLRQHFSAAIPAAIITADRNPEIRRIAGQMDGVSLLTKPVKPARLRALIAAAR